MIEAMKLAFADVYAHVADARHMQVPPEQMLQADYLASRARLIDPNIAQAYGTGHSPQGGTVYLTAADRSGMMVSFIQSNYMGFGSGVVVPGTGVSLQNRGYCFGLDPEHPNVVAGGKRPFHTIIPGFLMRDGAPVMSFGVMGGNMQPQDSCRPWCACWTTASSRRRPATRPLKWNSGLTVDVEPALGASMAEGLRARGHVLEGLDDPYMDFGSGQFIWRLGDPAVDGYVSASDSRRDMAAGF